MGIKKTSLKGLFAALITVCATVVSAADIPWLDDSVFEHRSVDEPLEEVLRKILNQNQLRGIFLQGVKAKDPISVAFDRVPLQAAFNQIVQENGLTYTYNEDKATVTVALVTEVETKFRLLTPRYMDLSSIESAIKRFEKFEPSLRESRPIFDHETGTILVRGNSDQVQELTALINTLDKGEKERNEFEQARLKERLKTQKIRRALNAADVVTRVIALQFANVGETKMSFQGQEVSIPGINETLFALLGLKDPDNAAKTVKQDEDSAFQSGAPLRLSVDKRTNAVIVRGTPRDVAEVEAIIERLDQPVPMIDMEVMIVQADAGLSENLGVQWSIAQKDANNKKVFGFSTGPVAGQTVQTLADNQLNANSTTSAITGSGGATVTNTQLSVDPITLLPLNTLSNAVASFIYNGPRSFVQAQINAASENDKAQIISSPHVVTLNNVPAKITSTDKIHVKIATRVGGEGDIKEIDAGLTLDITPSVISGGKRSIDKLVRLSISAKNSNFTSSLTTQEKELQTQVMLRDGSTFMLGGLFESRRRESEDGVPGLMDLPVIGALFRNRQSLDSRAETIFFITPKIIVQENILNQNIAVRDYMHKQRRRLEKDRYGLQTESHLIPNVWHLEEDE